MRMLLAVVLCVMSMSVLANPPIVEPHWEIVTSVGRIVNEPQTNIDADPYIITLKHDKRWITKVKEAAVIVSSKYTSSLDCQRVATKLDKIMVGKRVTDGHVHGIVNGSFCRVINVKVIGGVK